MEYIDKCHTIKVWFERDEYRLWAVTWKDKEGNQLGESELYSTKAEAVDMAKAYFHSGRCDILQIFTKDGAVAMSHTASISIEPISMK